MASWSKAVAAPVLTAVALAMCAVGASPAGAQGEIASDPLTISTSDANELQVRFTASELGEFDPPDVPTGQFGLMVETADALYGFAGDVSWGLVGDHQIDEPVPGQVRMTSRYRPAVPSPAFEVTEEIVYTPGTYEMRASYTFKSLLADGELTFTPKILANAAPSGESVGRAFDFGEGLRMTTSDRAAEINVTEVTGSSSPPWEHFEAGDFFTVADKVRAGQDFADTADPDRQDVGFGVQWPALTLGAGDSSDPHEIDYSFAHRLELLPRESTLDQGQTKTLNGQYAGADGLPQQKTLRLFVEGPNQQDDKEFTTELDGSFRIDLPGVNYGLDRVTVYEDVDGSFSLTEVDRVRVAEVGWRAPPQPADNLAFAMDEVEGVSVGGSYVTNPPGAVPLGPANKVINTAAAGFPRAGGQFALLTTGNGDAVFGNGSGGDAGGDLVRGAHDVTIMGVDLNVPAAANCLSLDLRFLSNEDPDPSNPFNDSFIAELDDSTWSVNGSGQVLAPNNFADDVNGRPLSVGGQGVVEMTEAGASGTNYGVGTGVLRARTPITPGSHTLYLSIFDLGDAVVDSAALVDKLEAISVPPEECVARLESPQAATRVDVDPATAGRTIGEQHTVSVAAFDAGDNPVADPLLRYFVSGANPVADSALGLAAGGTGQVAWFGGNVGDDELTIYRDVDGDEQMDPGERVGGSTVRWAAPIPPPETEPQQQQQQQQQQRQAELTLALAPVDEAALPGTTHTIRATALTDGVALPNATLRYRTEGTHPGSGEATTNAAGQASISVRGTRPGQDTVTVFLDADRDGSQGVGEAVAIARVEWLEPPKLKRTANADPVAGTVLIKLPPGTSLAKARRLGMAGATSGFIPLTEAKQIPLGSTLDTTRGRVQLQTVASNRNPGVTQAGDFYEGRFQILQVGSSRSPITEARLNEPLRCQPNRRGREVTQAGRRSRRLWGSGRGRFRTRGRNSTATVRGTVWLTKDTCTTTTTRVRSGTVVVRDFAKKKNVTVRRGRTYVARARRR